MVKTILSTSHSNTSDGTTTAGTTQYWLFGYASFEPNATESTREVIYRAPGTLSKLYVRLTANTTSTNGSITIRKNGAATALSVTVTAGSGAVVLEDADTVSVAAGDKLCIETVSGGTGTFTMTMVSCIWDATTNCNVRYVAKGYALTAASTTHFLPIAGDRSGTTTSEANVENTIKTAGTIKNGSVFISANARTTNTTFTVRDSRADTAMVITAGSGITGHREDTSNSISYAVDDELDWELTTSTGTQTLTAQSYAVDYETTSNNGVLTRGCVGTSADVIFTTGSGGVTWYMPIGGGSRNTITTESQVQMKAREAFTFKNLIAYTNSNNIAGNTIIALRVNGATSALTLTIGSVATGFFADTTHTVTVAAGDLINFIVTTTAIAGSLSLRQLGVTTEIAAGQAVERTLATETITMGGGTLTDIKGSIRTRSETVTIGETRARLAAKNRALATQTITVGADTIIRIKGKVKILSDTVLVSENLTRVAALTRIIATQVINISENRARIKGSIRSIPTQTVSISENIARQIARQIIRALTTETVAISEARTRIKGANRTINQTVVITAGTLARLKAGLRTISQTVLITDTRARVKGANRSIVLQTTTLSENLAKRMAQIRTLSLQSTIISEQLERTIAGANDIARSITETVIITGGSLTRALTQARSIITQTITITGPVNRIKAGNRTISESITIGSGILSRLKRISKAIIQNIIINENLNRLLSQTRIISQTIGIADNAQRLINILQQNIIRIATDSITILETLQLYVVSVSERFRHIKDPSIRRLKSNHPAWLVGSRGMHDGYEEFAP